MQTTFKYLTESYTGRIDTPAGLVIFAVRTAHYAVVQEDRAGYFPEGSPRHRHFIEESEALAWNVSNMLVFANDICLEAY